MSDDELLIRWAIRDNIPREQWENMLPDGRLVMLKLILRNDLRRRKVRARLLARIEYGDGYQIASQAWVPRPFGPPKKSAASAREARKDAAA